MYFRNGDIKFGSSLLLVHPSLQLSACEISIQYDQIYNLKFRTIFLEQMAVRNNILGILSFRTKYFRTLNSRTNGSWNKKY